MLKTIREKDQVRLEEIRLQSAFLGREVRIDFLMPEGLPAGENPGLLLINDGQDMEKMHFRQIIEKLTGENRLKPLLFAAIHAGADRRMEYGTASQPDYLGRGALAPQYSAFIVDELLPFIHQHTGISAFRETGFAGFSLGGLSALDIAWNHPAIFSRAGVFSGSFWWRSIDQEDEAYDDDRHRIMHQVIRRGQFAPGLQFFFQCGKLDETKDRNHNGIIDSIDDTLDLIRELEEKGYERSNDITYLELEDGHHDVFTWGRAMPVFLEWGWGRNE